MKLLNLVLYSETHPKYPLMKAETWKLYSQLPNVVTWYYRFEPSLPDSVVQVREGQRELTFGGYETFIPGILAKTMLAFNYAQSQWQASSSFDYVIRSNISSVVDFEVLQRLLAERPMDFGSTRLTYLNYLDPMSGIHNKSQTGFTFAAGVCMIFSPAAFEWLLKHQLRLVRTLIDDLSISKLVGAQFPPRLVADSPQWVVPALLSQEILAKVALRGDVALYRNRNNSDRVQDVHNMERIVAALLMRRQGKLVPPVATASAPSAATDIQTLLAARKKRINMRFAPHAAR